MAELGMVYRESTPYQVKCALCGKVTHNSYRVEVGDLGMMRFCMGLHASRALANYENNKKAGISPNNPEAITDDNQEGGDNING